MVPFFALIISMNKSGSLWSRKGDNFNVFFSKKQSLSILQTFNRISLDNDETARMVLSASIQRKLYRELVDFDNHLDQPSLDYWNSKLTEKLVVNL